jgi:hypothetical protein
MASVPVQRPHYQSTEMITAGKQANGAQCYQCQNDRCDLPRYETVWVGCQRAQFSAHWSTPKESCSWKPQIRQARNGCRLGI